MKHVRLAALFWLAVAAVPPGVSAQTAFKCGNSYSQSPCPGGTVIDAGDSRSSLQKAQTDAAASRDARAAEALEKARLKQAALARTASAPPDKPAANQAPATTSKASAKNKSKKPEYFTAQVPAEPRKKKKEKKVAVSGNSADADAAGKK